MIRNGIAAIEFALVISAPDRDRNARKFTVRYAIMSRVSGEVHPRRHATPRSSSHARLESVPVHFRPYKGIRSVQL